MASRSLLNLVLVVVVAGLVLLAFYEPGIEVPPEPQPLTSMARESVTRLAVERANQPKVKMEKRGGRWRVTEPFALPANAYRVGALLEILKTPSHGQLTVSDLERFSLAPPKAALSLNETRLDFGGTEPLSARRYVRQGDTVHLITDRFFYHLMARATDFVDYQLLGPEASPVEITLPDRRLALEDGRWTLTPDDPQVGADDLTRLVDAWRSAQAIDVKPVETREDGEAVSVRLRDQKEPIRFLVTPGEDEAIFARPGAGVQYHLPKASADALLTLHRPAPAPNADHTDTTSPGDPPATPGVNP